MHFTVESARHYKQSEAISAMGRIYGNYESPNSAPDKRYYQHYQDFYFKDWNDRSHLFQ